MYIDPFIISNIIAIMTGFIAFFYKVISDNQKITYLRFLHILVLYNGMIYTTLLIRMMYDLPVAPIILLFGPPLFFFYYYSHLKDKLPNSALLHFILPLLFILSIVINRVCTNLITSFFLNYLEWICLLLVLFYYGLSLKIFKNISTNKTDTELMNKVRKLHSPALSFLVALLIMIYLYPQYTFDYLLIYYSSMSIYFISSFLVKESVSDYKNRKKYSNSGLNHDQKTLLLDQIKMLFESEHILKPPGLSLQFVADKVETTPNNVSQVVNELMGISFPDFVNQCRIEYAKKLLKENNNWTIEGIALSAGFQSKSAFYTAFKKCTGLNPTEFKKCNPAKQS